MRIVVATPLYPPEIGGPATYAKILFEGLSGKAIEVELVKFGDIRHLPKFIRHIAYARRVYRALHNADLVLALDPVSVGLPACFAAWLAKKPFVVKIVGDYAWEQGRQRFGITQNLDEFVKIKNVPFFVRVFRHIQTRVALRAARVIVPSNYLKSIVVTWGVPADKIQVIYNAVPIEELGNVPESVKKLSRPLIVTAGRLVPWKNMEGVIDAVAMLRKKGNAATLVLIGEGPLYGKLSARASENLKEACVMTGILTHPDMLATVKVGDVFVLNSSYEGLSHHLIEALALGKPIIATRVGGNPEVIADGENGLLIPVGDMPALVDALARLLDGGEFRARLQTAAGESSKRFSAETMLLRTSDFLKALDIRCPNP
ncbi:MAG: glycosyltransferase family 4 protein [Minisyncoccia bacterium]|jgi:glycosyltransferase involved in cell wall biosynthesis